MRRFFTILLMLALLIMPGTEALLAQEYTEKSVQSNDLKVPPIEADADYLDSMITSQQQFINAPKQADLDNSVNPESTGEQPVVDKGLADDAGEELTLEAKNEEIDTILREVNENDSVNDAVYRENTMRLDAKSDFIPIRSAQDLFNIRDNLTGNYVQMADIDLSSYPNWDPIDMFNGTYDGNGFNITKLKITRSSEDRIGLFGDLKNTTGCVLKNINLLNALVSGNRYVGGLVGWTDKSTKIYNCKVNGAINGYNSFSGGMVGVNPGEMKQCKFVTPGYINGTWGVGGLVGFNASGTITQCYSTGDVFGSDSLTYAGGLTGAHSGNINNCYSTGGVYASSFSGGLTGHIVANGSINRCYAAGLVSCSSDGGGLVGDIVAGTVAESYYDRQTTSMHDSGKGEPRTTEEMKQLSTYINWDFASTWGISSDFNNGYPYLMSPSEEIIPVIVIPGIMGSELYAAKDDYKCWPNTFHINDGLRRLYVNDNGESDEVIRVGGFLEQPDYYSEMIDQLRAAGFKVEQFPYDWRMDNNTNADRLQDMINSTLLKYNADKVDIVAHSMGGLVSKAYLNEDFAY